MVLMYNRVSTKCMSSRNYWIGVHESSILVFLIYKISYDATQDFQFKWFDSFTINVWIRILILDLTKNL